MENVEDNKWEDRAIFLIYYFNLCRLTVTVKQIRSFRDSWLVERINDKS